MVFVVVGSFVVAIGLWVWISFLSDNAAPFGIKPIGTTSFALVIVALLLLGGLALLDRIYPPRAGRARAQRRRPADRYPSRPLQIDVWRKCDGRCQWEERGQKCGRRDDLHFDHIVPFSKGGPTTFHNFQLRRCLVDGHLDVRAAAGGRLGGVT